MPLLLAAGRSLWVNRSAARAPAVGRPLRLAGRPSVSALLRSARAVLLSRRVLVSPVDPVPRRWSWLVSRFVVTATPALLLVRVLPRVLVALLVPVPAGLLHPVVRGCLRACASRSHQAS